MTDRGKAALRLTPARIGIGPSSMAWEGDKLVIRIDERAVPHFGRLRGSVRLIPTAITAVELPLTPDGAHVWRPFAPVARIEVAIDRPGWRWSGHGYFDANFGLRPLEADFSRWTWARMPAAPGALAFYDAILRDGTQLQAAARFGADGTAEPFAPPPPAALPRSRWGVRRTMRADPGTTPRQVKAMLDAPFYTRAAVESTIAGRTTTGVHEALDLDRYASRWIKPMLAFKVPRRARWLARE